MTTPRPSTPSQAQVSSRSLPVYIRVIALFAFVFIAYWPVLSAGFIWDDDGHVTRPALRSLHGLWQIWFELGATQQYYPVLHSAFWIEHRLWGDAAIGYHLFNVFLHATAACLFALVLKRLLLPGKASLNLMHAGAVPDKNAEQTANRIVWLAAALFALHPVGVESVAWVAEQKNTLSINFYLLSALAYLRFSGARRWTWYWTGLALFVLACLTKSVTATLPAALLVVLWWRRGRLSWRTDVLPLLPWLGIGLGAGFVTAWIERNYIGAQGAQFDLGLAERILIAGHAACFYFGKLAWPHPLIFIYPHWSLDARSLAQWLYPTAVLGVIALLVVVCRRTRGPLAVALCFLGTLFPALGFFNVYPFVFSYVADHFQYLASLSIFSLVAIGLVTVANRAPASTRWLANVAAAALLFGLGVLTWQQSATYRDSQTLYRTTLQRNPASWLAHDNLGVILASQGHVEEAIPHYQAALRLNPRYPESFNNLGNAWAGLKKWNDAYSAYASALRLKPRFVEAEINWGNALSTAGSDIAAIPHYEAALQVRPHDSEGLYRLANSLANSNRLPEAMDRYADALRSRPDFPEAEANLGLALATTHRPAEALPHLERAVHLNPRYAEAHAYFGFALAQLGKPSEAAAEYRASLAINPADANVHYQLGLALRALGQFSQAADEFEAANRPASRRQP